MTRKRRPAAGPNSPGSLAAPKPKKPSALEKARADAARAKARAELAKARAELAKAKRAELELEQARAATKAATSSPSGARGPGVYRTDADLARALGLSPGWLSRLKKRAWFPKRPAGGWQERPVCLAIIDNLDNDRGLVDQLRERVASWDTPAGANTRPSPGTSASSAAAPAPDPAVQEALAELAEAGQDPLLVAQATARLASARLADAFRKGRGSDKDLAAMRAALEHLAKVEREHLELERRRGELVARAVLPLVGGELARVVGEALQSLEALFPTQVEVWLGDPAFAALEVGARRAAVVDWVTKTTRGLRAGLADELERMAEDAVKESQDG